MWADRLLYPKACIPILPRSKHVTEDKVAKKMAWMHKHTVLCKRKVMEILEGRKGGSTRAGPSGVCIQTHTLLRICIASCILVPMQVSDSRLFRRRSSEFSTKCRMSYHSRRRRHEVISTITNCRSFIIWHFVILKFYQTSHNNGY